MSFFNIETRSSLERIENKFMDDTRRPSMHGQSR